MELNRPKTSWGYLFFCLIGLLSYFSLWSHGIGGHYAIFSGAAQDLWSGIDPYGKVYSSSGFWLYSPGCALYFFGLFALFPPYWGHLLYMGISLLVLFVGTYIFAKYLEKKLGPESKFWIQLLLVLCSSELIGSILNSRIEVIMTGLVLLSFICILRLQKWWSYFILSMLCNWKFQMLPVALLLVLAERDWRQKIQSALYLILGISIWTFLPILVLPWTFFVEILQTWQSSFENWIHGPYQDFENWQSYLHIYAWLFKNCDWNLSYIQCQIISLIVGLLLGLYVFIESRKEDLRIIALGLGCGFANVFSPLSQSSAYITLLPLYFAGLSVFLEKKLVCSRQALYGIFGITWIFTSLLSSDFVPKTLRIWSFVHAYKPLGALFLMLTILICKFRHIYLRKGIPLE